MDIICAKCGMHFSSIESAREHSGHCRATSENEPVHWLPSDKTKLSQTEWTSLMKLIGFNKKEPTNSEPKIPQISDDLKVQQNHDSVEEPPKEAPKAPDLREAKPEPFSPVHGTARKNQGQKPASTSPTHNGTASTSQRDNKDYITQPWFLTLLLIFTLSIVGVVLSLILGNTSPLFILLGVSIVFSIEHWFYYRTVQKSITCRPYKLFLNLFLIYLTAIAFWSGVQLFSHKLVLGPLAGSIIFIAELIILFFIYRVQQKHRKRWPSIKLTVFGLAAVTLILAFAGVEPLSTYKNEALDKLKAASSSISKAAADFQSTVSTPQPSVSIPITAKPIPTVPTLVPIAIAIPIPVPVPVPSQVSQVSAERLAFNLINNERVKAGLSPTTWDDNLYQLSMAHTQEMANQTRLFHSDINAPIGEDAWGGSGYSSYSGADLAQAIVDSWMSSPLHRAWILNVPFQHSVVSIVSDSSGQWASWTFWTAEIGEGPPLVQKASQMWQAETGGSIPWLTWLYDVKGYPNNQEFLKQLGVK